MKPINEHVKQASQGNSIVPGFNVFGWEDASALVRAAERAQAPILLMVNRDARRAMDLRHWGALLSSIAGQARVPVGVHLDHCTDLETIRQAMDWGFTSVMYDGSKLPIGENCANSRQVVQWARSNNIAVEGEVGTVPYDDLGETEAETTSPAEAKQIWEESGLDWLAVSVGNIHRLTDRKADLDFGALSAIQSVCPAPLVIHGASGIREEEMEQLKKTHVGKVNIGTTLRRVLGESLRHSFIADPHAFDRLALFKEPVRKLEEAAFDLICRLK